MAVTAWDSARSCATATSSARICMRSAIRVGMKMAIPSSMTLLVTTVCPRARPPLHLRRPAPHPRLRLLRPGDDLLGLDVERRVELAAGEQHVARRQPQNVLGVGAQIDLR